ncbi:TPA: UxaA family hydrolase [Candidatus Bathyarchaeota archaeon]|nr:UxaA family hydrolase [Candidatus Bathyarchaeota archaeon]
MVKKAIQIDEKDNIATTTSEVEAGEALEVTSPDGAVILRPKVAELIPFGHKLAIKPIKKGENIVKYGEIIGIATQPVKAGAWVNTHNVGSARMPTSGKEAGIL